MVVLLSDSVTPSYLRRQHSHQLAELLRSHRYLGVRLGLVNTQVENMLEDYRREIYSILMGCL